MRLRTTVLIVVAIAIVTGVIGYMADDLKVYTPTTIEETPLPTEQGVESNGTPGGGGVAAQTYAPTTTRPKGIPKKIIAYESIGSALNTKSRKILGEFELVDQGAMRIGKYQNGVSGEIVLTPAGITAKNQAGNTTLGIDVDTGGAVFQGEIRAADFIVADDKGLVSLNNFDSNYVDNENVHTLVPGGTYTEVDVTSAGGNPMVVELDLDRQSNVLIFAAASGRNETAGGFQLMAIYRDNGNGASPFTRLTGNIRISGAINDAAGGLGDTSSSIIKIITLEAGHHRLALRHRASGSQQVQIKDMTLGYMVLGR